MIDQKRGRRPVPAPLARPFDAVVWDYDGTLVDTRPSDEAAVAGLLARDPAAAAGVAAFWESEGRPLLERLERAWPGQAEAVLPLFDAPAPPRAYAPVRPALEALRRAGVGQGVVSSRRLEPLRRGLAAARIGGYFSSVVGLESVGACKPDPEGLLLALRTLGVSPARAVYVGDLGIDIEAARNAAMTGWLAVWSRTPGGRRRPDEVASPGDVVDRVLGVAAAAG